MPPLVPDYTGCMTKPPAAPGAELLYAISRAFEEEVAQGDLLLAERSSDDPIPLSVFDGHAVPTMTVTAYIERLNSYMNCSAECFLLALPLLARVLGTDSLSPSPTSCSSRSPSSQFHLHSKSAHRLIGTATVIAAKFHDDAHLPNAYYSTVVGVPLKELNKLEASFLNALSFRVYVPAEEFERWRERVTWAVVDSALQLPLSPLTAAPPGGDWGGFGCSTLTAFADAESPISGQGHPSATLCELPVCTVATPTPPPDRTVGLPLAPTGQGGCAWGRASVEDVADASEHEGDVGSQVQCGDEGLRLGVRTTPAVGRARKGGATASKIAMTEGVADCSDDDEDDEDLEDVDHEGREAVVVERARVLVQEDASAVREGRHPFVSNDATGGVDASGTACG